MSIKRIYAIFIRQLYLLIGNPVRLTNFIWIAIDLILWGFITKYFGTLNLENPNIATVLLGAVILWGFMTRVQQGLMVAFFEDVWSHNFINYFSSPLKKGEYISGLVLNSIFSALLGFLLLIIVSGLFFGYNIFKVGIFIMPFLFILFVFGISLGIFACAVVLRFGPSAEWIAWPLIGMLSPLAGVFYPISVLPQALEWVARALPASYVFEGMRSILISGEFGSRLYLSLLIGLILSVIYLLLSYLFFAFIYRRVLREGMITRFSAES